MFLELLPVRSCDVPRNDVPELPEMPNLTRVSVADVSDPTNVSDVVKVSDATNVFNANQTNALLSPMMPYPALGGRAKREARRTSCCPRFVLGGTPVSATTNVCDAT